MLKVYDEVRRPRAQRVWSDTYRAGLIYDELGPHGSSAQGIQQDLDGLWEYTWKHSPDDDIVEAEHRLQDLGVYASFAVAHL